MPPCFRLPAYRRPGTVLLVLLGLALGAATSAVAAESEDGARFSGWRVQELALEGWPQDLGAAPRSGLALGLKSGVLRPKRPPSAPSPCARTASGCFWCWPAGAIPTRS